MSVVFTVVLRLKDSLLFMVVVVVVAVVGSSVTGSEGKVVGEVVVVVCAFDRSPDFRRP
jgi:hypothetical protein